MFKWHEKLYFKICRLSCLNICCLDKFSRFKLDCCEMMLFIHTWFSYLYCWHLFTKYILFLKKDKRKHKLFTYLKHYFEVIYLRIKNTDTSFINIDISFINIDVFDIDVWLLKTSMFRHRCFSWTMLHPYRRPARSGVCAVSSSEWGCRRPN